MVEIVEQLAAVLLAADGASVDIDAALRREVLRPARPFPPLTPSPLPTQRRISCLVVRPDRCPAARPELLLRLQSLDVIGKVGFGADFGATRSLTETGGICAVFDLLQGCERPLTVQPLQFHHLRP